MKDYTMTILFLVFSILYLPITSFADKQPSSPTINFQYIQSLAENLAKKTYTPNIIQKSDKFGKSFKQRVQIQYKWDKGLWKKEGSPFYIAFMPITEKFDTQVNLYEVDDGKAKKIKFNADNFDYGTSGVKPYQMPKAFSGFRIVSSKDNKDILIFQGGSYFRPIPPECSLGLSLRALTINTVIDGAEEEFPDFTDFLLVNPKDESGVLKFYALLNSNSVAGAYEFTLNYDKEMTIEVRSTIILKNSVAELGFAPITSQFWYGENSHINFKQARPEVHNSDGLIMKGNNVHYWNSLANYIDKPALNSYNHFKSLDYFGLLQRDRNFANYADLLAYYNLNPNVWINIDKKKNTGNVRLVILPTKTQYTDNVNTFWITDKKPEVGKPFDFNYTVNTSLNEPSQSTANVNHFWEGLFKSSVYNNKGYFFSVSFSDGELSNIYSKAKITPNISIIGPAKVSGTPIVTYCKDINSWIASFYVKPDNKNALTKAINIKCYLTLDNKAVTETWSYFWYPVRSQSVKYQ